MEVPLDEIAILTNSDLFHKANLFGETILMLENNPYNPEMHPALGRPSADIEGKVYMFDTLLKTGSFSCEMQFLKKKKI